MSNLVPKPQEDFAKDVKMTFQWSEWFTSLRNLVLPLQNGVSGTFISGDATPKTITVVKGVITSIL